MDIINDILPFVKPTGRDENGKFNKKLYNLFKLISKNEYSNRQLRIFFKPKSWWDGSYINFHKNIHKEIHSLTRQIVLSPYGMPHTGYSLMEALSKNKPEVYSWIMHNTEDFIDVTEWFFNTYRSIGRCMFDNLHHDFDNQYNNRYYLINKNHRKCRWCGKHFHRVHHKQVEVRKYTIWKESVKEEP